MIDGCKFILPISEAGLHAEPYATFLNLRELCYVLFVSAAETRSIRREGLLFFIGVFCLYLLTSAGFDTSEGLFHYKLAQQMLSVHVLNMPKLEDGPLTVAPNGKAYIAHEIGNSLFMIPVAALNSGVEKYIGPIIGDKRAQYVQGLLLSWMSCFYCSMTLTLLYVMARLIFSLSIQDAIAGCLLFGLTTFFWTYSRSLFDGVLCAPLLVGGVLLLFLYRHSRHLLHLYVAFCLLGVGVITRITMAVPVFCGMVFLTIIERDIPRRMLKTIAVAILALAPFAVWQMYYNHLRTGSVLTSPLQVGQFDVANGLHGNIVVGLFGLFLSPGKSLLLYCPTVLLGMICWPRFYKKFRTEALSIGMLTLCWLVLHAKLIVWHGGWGWGPRYMVTIAPLASISYIAMQPSCRARSFRVIASISIAVGLILALASTVGNWHYRESLYVVQGHDPNAFVWSPTSGQATDMVRGAVQNLSHVMLGSVATPPILSQSYANYVASTTCNLWWITAIRLGTPAPLVLCVCLFLIGVVAYCGGCLSMLAEMAAPQAEAAPGLHIASGAESLAYSGENG